MYPLVSILIPAYNAERWVKSSITSALNQTWPKIEIIIVDDGSTDNTLKIAKDFKSSFVKVVSQENKGASAARNYALSFAQGDYIQWLDADDILAPNKIEFQLIKDEYAANDRVLYTSAWGFFYFRPSRTKFKPDSLWQNHFPIDWMIKYMSDGCMMPNNTWMVSRFLTEKAGGWDEVLTLNDDGEYFFRVVRSSEFVVFRPKSRCYYRKGNLTSLSSIRFEKSLESWYRSIQLDIGYLLKLRNDEISRKACIIYLNNFKSSLPQNSKIIKSVDGHIVELGGSVAPILESTGFHFARKSFGKKNALWLKYFFWLLRNNTVKYYDYFSGKLFHDSY